MKSEVKISGNRLLITRVFDAPRQLVFAWWTQAEKLQQWSGCKAATRCEIKMDFRVGGSFTQKMHIAGAGEFSFTASTTRSSSRKGFPTTLILAKPSRE